MNSGSYDQETERRFVDPVPVEPEPDWHLEILVLARRTGTVGPESSFKQESKLEHDIANVFLSCKTKIYMYSFLSKDISPSVTCPVKIMHI